MKKLIAIIFLGLMSAATNAAPVTITFDDPASETYTYYSHPDIGYIRWMTIEKGGFVVTAEGLATNQGDRSAFSGEYEVGDGGTFAYELSIKRSDGGAFAVHSFDWAGANRVRYVLAGGGFTDVALNYLNPDDIGSGVQLNVTTAYLFYYDDYPYPGMTYIDNIVVSAVPVPAAVWLFASGLGLLAWVRQRRAVSSI